MGFMIEYALNLLSKKRVTIKITELDNGYAIAMSFDNQYNLPEL